MARKKRPTARLPPTISRNSNGGHYVRGRAYGIEKKADVAFDLQQFGCLSSLPKEEWLSLRKIANKNNCLPAFVTKIRDEIIEHGCVQDPKMKQWNCLRGPGSKSLTFLDKRLLLNLYMVEPKRSLQSYADHLAFTTGTRVHHTTICKFFCHGFDIRGSSVRHPNFIPKDKFKPKNIIKFFQYLDHIARISSADGSFRRIKFGDEKLLKGSEVYCRNSRRNVFTGEVPPVFVESDFRNTYCVTGFCGIDPNGPPLFWVINQEKNDSHSFAESLELAIHRGFLVRGDVLILDNAAIHNGGTNRNIEERVFEEHGVLILFLPPRSPELNPIELVWAGMVRKLRSLNMNILKNVGAHKVAEAAQQVLYSFTHSDIEKLYRHCEYHM